MDEHDLPPPEAMDNSLLDKDQIPDFCTTITFHVMNANDLERRCLQSDFASLSFPEHNIDVCAFKDLLQKD